MGLSGPQLRTVNAALLDAFGLAELDRLLLQGLDLQLEHLSVGRDLAEVVFAVTRELNRRERVPELVHAARGYNPTNLKLIEAADGLLTAPVRAADRPTLERILRDGGGFLDAAAWHRRLGELQARVAYIEVPSGTGRTSGTAFLVGPDLVLTNQHVLAPVLDGTVPAGQVRVRFDYQTTADGHVLRTGAEFGLAGQWRVAVSPPSAADLDGRGLPGADELDFAVVRLAGNPGAEPVSAVAGVLGAPARGWLRPPAPFRRPAPGEPLFVLQHPRGAPLRLAFDRVAGLNDNGTRLRHGVDTEPGSSGSPCLDRNLDLVAVHHSTDPTWRPHTPGTYNQAIPVDAIQRHLGGLGLQRVVFADG
jgi:hypothetical protein